MGQVSLITVGSLFMHTHTTPGFLPSSVVDRFKSKQLARFLENSINSRKVKIASVAWLLKRPKEEVPTTLGAAGAW